MNSYQPIILVISLIVILIVLPNLYWRIRIWFLKRRDFVSESEFLQKNNLRRDEVSAAMEGGPHLRVRRVRNENFIDGTNAALILKRVASMKLAEKVDGAQKSGLSAAAGAAIGAVVVASTQLGKSSTKDKEHEEEKTKPEAEKEFMRNWERTGRLPSSVGNFHLAKIVYTNRHRPYDDSLRQLLEDDQPNFYQFIRRYLRQRRHHPPPFGVVERILKRSFEIWADTEGRIKFDNWPVLESIFDDSREEEDASQRRRAAALLQQVKSGEITEPQDAAEFLALISLLNRFELISPTSRRGRMHLRLLRILRADVSFRRSANLSRAIFFAAEAANTELLDTSGEE